MAAGAPVVPGGGGGPRGRGPRRPGGPGGPGGGGGGSITLKLGGKPENLTVTVRVTGNNPPARAEFRLGIEGNDLAAPLQVGGAIYQVTIDNATGIGLGNLNFVGLDEQFITLTAIAGRLVSQPVPIPRPATVLAAGVKTKQMKVLPEGETTSFGKAIRRDFQTFAADGKALEPSRIRIVAESPMTMKDAATGQLLRIGRRVARRVKFFEFETGRDGMRHVDFEFTGFVIKIRAIHIQTGAVIEFTLRHR